MSKAIIAQISGLCHKNSLFPAKFGQNQSFISLFRHPDTPAVYKEQEGSPFKILHFFHIRSTA